MLRPRTDRRARATGSSLRQGIARMRETNQETNQRVTMRSKHLRVPHLRTRVRARGNLSLLRDSSNNKISRVESIAKRAENIDISEATSRAVAAVVVNDISINVKITTAVAEVVAEAETTVSAVIFGPIDRIADRIAQVEMRIIMTNTTKLLALSLRSIFPKSI